MSDFDDAINNLFPNEEQRNDRRAKLHRAIDAYLDAGFVESDGGWAQVEREHLDDLRDIFDEIIDLKVQRDPDGDPTIVFALGNRRVHHMHTVYQTYGLRSRSVDISDGDSLDWLVKATREADYAQSVAKSVADNVRCEIETMHHLAEMEREKKKKHEAYAARLETIAEQVGVEPFDYVGPEFVNFQRDAARESLLFDYAPLQRAMSLAYPADLEAAIVDVEARQNAAASDNDEGFRSNVVVPRTQSGRIFGKTFYNDPRIEDRAQFLSQEGRRIRAEMREAKRTKS